MSDFEEKTLDNNIEDGVVTEASEVLIAAGVVGAIVAALDVIKLVEKATDNIVQAAQRPKYKKILDTYYDIEIKGKAPAFSSLKRHKYFSTQMGDKKNAIIGVFQKYGLGEEYAMVDYTYKDKSVCGAFINKKYKASVDLLSFVLSQGGTIKIDYGFKKHIQHKVLEYTKYKSYYIAYMDLSLGFIGEEFKDIMRIFKDWERSHKEEIDEYRKNKKVKESTELDNMSYDELSSYLESVYEFTDLEDDIEVILSESAISYINDENNDVEESAKDAIINAKTNIIISAKLRKNIIKLAIMKAKLNNLSKDPVKNKIKINTLKREIISVEKEKRELTSHLNSSAKGEVKKLEGKASKEASKEVKKVTPKEKKKTTEVKKESVLYDKKSLHFIEKYEDQIKKNNEVIEECMKEEAKHTNKISAIRKENEDLSSRINYIKENAKNTSKAISEKVSDILTECINSVISSSGTTYHIANSDNSKDLIKEKSNDTIIFLKTITKNDYEGNLTLEAVDLYDRVNLRRYLSAEIDALTKCKNDLAYPVSLYKENADVKMGSEIIDRLKKYIVNERALLSKIYNEAGNPVLEAAKIEGEIKGIIAELNRKGYTTKYSSPGHIKLRKKEDQEPDGVYKGKLYSDARVMFDGKYKFPDAPKYWYFRTVDNCDYLDVTPITYNDSDGTPDEAFKKWKTNYMNSLREWVHNLKENGSSDQEGGKDIEASKDKMESAEVTEDATTDKMKEQLEKMKAIQAKTDTTNKKADGILGKLNAKFGLKKESMEIDDGMEEVVTEDAASIATIIAGGLLVGTYVVATIAEAFRRKKQQKYYEDLVEAMKAYPKKHKDVVPMSDFKRTKNIISSYDGSMGKEVPDNDDKAPGSYAYTYTYKGKKCYLIVVANGRISAYTHKDMPEKIKKHDMYYYSYILLFKHNWITGNIEKFIDKEIKENKELKKKYGKIIPTNDVENIHIKKESVDIDFLKESSDIIDGIK